MTVPSDFDKPTGQVIHGATEFTELRDRSVWFVLFFVAAAFLVEIIGRFFRSSIPVPVPEVISFVAILMLLAPALYLILRRKADIVLRCSIVLAVTFAILSQMTIICESTPYCDAWPILSRHSRWHGTARSICQVFGLVLLLGTFYFALLSALRTKAVLLRHGQNLAREVVERQRAEEMYRRENIFREAIIENSAEGLCVCHTTEAFPHLVFTIWNRRMTEITGYTLEEVNRLGWYECMYPDEESRTRAAERIARASNGDNFEKEEWLMTRRDGGSRTLCISTSVMEGFGEQPQVLAIVLDITAHKTAEEALVREAMLRRALFEKSKDGIAVLTLDGSVFEANEAMADMLGYTPEELSGLRVSDWDAQWTLDELVEKLRELSRVNATFETVHRRKDGALYNVEVSANGVTSGEQILVYCVHRDITRRKRAESALLESETRYRRIVDTATEGIWAFDEDRMTTFVNARAAEMLGYREEDILGRCVDEFVWAEDVPTAHTQFSLRREGAPGRYEIRCRHRNGSAVWMIVSGAPIWDNEGRFSGSFAMLTDITTRKHAEDALREREEKYRLIFEGTKEAIFFLDCGNRLDFFNDRLAEICGYAVEELTSKPVMSLVHPEDLACIQENNRRRFAGEAFEHTYEFRVVHRNGHPVEVEGTFNAITRDDKVIGICGLLRDISDRKRAQAELELIRAYAPCLLWHADVESLDGKPQWSISVSSEEAAQRFMPLNLEAGQSYYDALAENREEFATEAHQLHEDAARAFREGATHLRHEFPCRRSDGEIRWIDENAYIQSVAPGRWRVIGVSTDITERKKAEEERLKLESQLLYAQKMESIGILAGGIAHDFNNILASILGNAELALVDVDQASPAHANLQEIESSAQRAADLTRQMLAYSGKGKFMVRPVLISDEIPELVKLLTASISKKCALECDFPSDLPRIEADVSQIHQIIINLVVNAAEAIGDKEGTITLRGRAMECDRDYLSECYIDDQLPTGHYVALEVTDTGGGIAPEVYPRLFDPFFSTRFVGRGLGLAAVMGIVRSHHGAIRVTSEPGVRATFTVLFPACDPGRIATTDAAPSRQTDKRAGRTILVVDDEAAVRNLTVKALERAGYRVITAGDGRQGVERFRDNADKISLVLLDMTMPYKDGGEVFQEIRQLRRDAKVILSSGFSEEDTMERFGQHGLAGFIQKPYRVTDLLGIISSALNSPGQ